MQRLKASENDHPEEGPKDRKERKDGGHEPLLLVADAHQNIQVQGNEWHQEWETAHSCPSWQSTMSLIYDQKSHAKERQVEELVHLRDEDWELLDVVKPRF